MVDRSGGYRRGGGAGREPVPVRGDGQRGAGGGQGRVRPKATGELDCNGYSKIQKALTRKLACTDIRGMNGYPRFFDNGHYIGHDEPSIRFISKRPGSGNNVTFTERLPMDPKAMPTTGHPGHDVIHWFELSVAPWFGMSMCDPNSFPQTTLHAQQRQQRPARLVPRRRRGVHGDAVLPARLRAVRRLGEL